MSSYVDGQVTATQLAFAPQDRQDLAGVERMPAAADAVLRFERLMYAPGADAAAVVRTAGTSAAGQSGLHHYVEQLSRRWEAGQSALQKVMDTGTFSSQELVVTQMQMINCALDVEVSSKCASMLENGVQTLIQRGS